MSMAENHVGDLGAEFIANALQFNTVSFMYYSSLCN